MIQGTFLNQRVGFKIWMGAPSRALIHPEYHQIRTRTPSIRVHLINGLSLPEGEGASEGWQRRPWVQNSAQVPACHFQSI